MNSAQEGPWPVRWRHLGRVLAITVALAFVAVPLAFIAWRDLASPNLWFDEGGQVYLAAGLYHYSAPNAPDGGFAGIIQHSRGFNSDPGGFTIALRYWMKLFGSSPAALRALPFLFAVLLPISILLAARRVGATPLVAALAASAPLAYPMLLYYATEIRAYSMEALAVAVFFFLPSWRDDEPRGWMISVTGAAAAFLVLSRYSAFLYAASACLVSALPLRPLPAAMRRAVRFSLPVVAAAGAAYLLFASYQGGASARPPSYVDAYLLHGKDAAERLALLEYNFLSTGALPIPIFLLAAPLFAFFGPRSLTRLRALAGRAWLFTAVSVLLIAVASIAGKLPWAWGLRWSIGYQSLAACCLALGATAVLMTVWTAARSSVSRALAAAVVTCVAAAWSFQLRDAMFADRPYFENMASQLQALADSPNAKSKSLRLYVQHNGAPTVRYLLERGPLKGTFEYPKNVHFETADEAGAGASIAAKDYDVVVLTHAESVDEYRRRIVGDAFDASAAPPPSSLLLARGVFGGGGKTTFSATGLDTAGRPLPDGAEDPHYRYTFVQASETSRRSIQSGGASQSRPVAAVTGRYGWLGDESATGSRWVTVPGANPVAYGAPGYYVFSTAFTVSGFDLSSFKLVGRWLSDNEVADVRLNGRAVAFGGSPSSKKWTAVTIGPSPYFQKDNTLDIVVFNGEKQPNPVGLRLEAEGTEAGLPAAMESWAGAPPSILMGVVAALLAVVAVVAPQSGARLSAPERPTMKIKRETSIDKADRQDRSATWYGKRITAPVWALITAGLVMTGLASLATLLLKPAAKPEDFGPQAPASASFVKADSTTLGNWKGAYGSLGFALANDRIDLPAFARITPPLQDKVVTWVDGPDVPRALQKAQRVGRIAATWWAWDTFDIDVDLKGAKTHRITLYAIDWDSETRVEKVEILDARTQHVLDVREAAGFSNGIYLSWNMTGHVIMRVTHLAGANAVASAVFVD